MRKSLLVLALCAGCTGAGSAPVFLLAVDSDRDGKVSLDPKSADVQHRNEWSTKFGAIFLANVDDDDKKGKIDASDTIVNGAMDELDLARVWVVPWKRAPSDVTATVAPDAATAPNVHLFRHNTDGTWTLWD